MLKKLIDVGRGLPLLLIRSYQRFVSPFMGKNCRYEPTCSSYMYSAIETHGLLPGLAMGARRIARCHPWHEGGFDPVPGVRGSEKTEITA